MKYCDRYKNDDDYNYNCSGCAECKETITLPVGTEVVWGPGIKITTLEESIQVLVLKRDPCDPFVVYVRRPDRRTNECALAILHTVGLQFDI